MRRESWRRFAIEAAFLILVAVGAGMLDLDRRAIVAVMALAYLGVVAVEWIASRGARARRRPAPVAAGADGAVLAPSNDPAAEPERPESRPSRRTRHVRILARERMPPAEPPAPAPDGAPPPLREPLPPSLDPPGVDDAEGAPPAPEPLTPEEEAAPPGAPAADADLASEPEAGALEAVELAPPALETNAASAEDDAHAGDGPREWNLWELERIVREASGEDPARDEERSFLLVYLREFARSDGDLPIDFDGLVRDSFGDLIAAASR